MEKTFIIIKPDAIEKKLIGTIISRIEQNDLSIVYAKRLKVTKEQANEHYAHIRELDFYDEMIDYFTSNPVVAMIIEGKNAISKMRGLAGKAVNPAKGTIRADFGVYRYKNLIHTADSVESYKIEAARFLKEFAADADKP